MVEEDPEFYQRFLGLVTQVKSGKLELSLEDNCVNIYVSGEQRISMPIRTFISMEVNQILDILGEDYDSKPN